MYHCQYCGRTLSVAGEYVEVCQCEEALKEEQASKERNKQVVRQNKQTFEEARRKNKRPLRGK